MLLPATLRKQSNKPKSVIIGPSRDRPSMDLRSVISAFNLDSPWLRSIISTIATSVAMVKLVPSALKEVKRKDQRRSVNELSEKTSRIKLAPAHERLEIAYKLVNDDHSSSEFIELVDHPLTDLLRGRNGPLTGFALMYITQVYQELAGEAFWYLERNKSGVPIAAVPIPPLCVVGFPTKEDQTYKVTYQPIININSESMGKIQAVKINKDDIIRFTWPDPVDPLSRGSGTGLSLRLEIDSDRYASALIRNRFINNAIPPVLLSLSDPLGDKIDELKRYWLNEANALWLSGVPMIVNTEFQAYEFSNTFQSMQFVELRQQQRDIIIESFGIPPEIIGHIQNANRSTITAARGLYYELRIIPRIECNIQTIENQLVRQFDERIILVYKSPLKDENEYNLRAATVMPSSVTIDEWRTKFQGLPPIGGKLGKSFPVKSNTEVVNIDQQE